MLEHRPGIYKCTCSGNGKVYIGQSVDIALRRSQHMSELRYNNHFNQYLQNSFNKYGEDSFIWEAVEYCDSDQLNERETFWIDYFDCCNNGFNANGGGAHNRSYIHTDEHRRHMSECMRDKWTPERRSAQADRMRGENNPMFGRSGKLSPSFGRRLCGKDSPTYGYHHTEESKEKNRLAHLGANNKMSKPVVCEETQVIFDSQGEAGRTMKCDSSTINKCCRGVKKTAGGYHWRYATKEEIESKHK